MVIVKVDDQKRSLGVGTMAQGRVSELGMDFMDLKIKVGWDVYGAKLQVSIIQ